MSELYLEFPSKKRERDAKMYLQEFIDSGSDINGMGWLDKYKDYDEWLKLTCNYRDGIDIDKDHVRSTEYFLIRRSDDKIVGMVNIRHSLNNYLIERGYGHIGYGVRPGERKKGYATIQLKLSLEKCRELGIKTVHVGCNEDNIGSRRTIEKNGGVLFNKGDNDGVPYLEFIIEQK